MAQDNWWANDKPASAPAPAPRSAPVSSGPIVGPPPLPKDPPQPREPKTTYRTLSEAEVRQNGLDPKKVWQISSEGNISLAGDRQGASTIDPKPTEYQSKSAGFLGRLVQSEQIFNNVPAGSRDARTLPGQWLHDLAPSVDAVFNSSDRVTADNAARNFVSASLRQESGAAIGQSEFENQYRIFFPMPGDTEEQIKQKAAARQQAIEGFKVAAGPLAEQTLSTIVAVPGSAQRQQNDGTQDIEKVGGLAKGTEITFGGDRGPDGWWDRNAWLEKKFGLTSDQETNLLAFWNQNVGNQNLTREGVFKWYADNGLPVPQSAQAIADTDRKIQLAKEGRTTFTPFDDSADKEARKAELDRMNAASMGSSNDAGGFDPASARSYLDRFTSAPLTALNLNDEAAGFGGAIGAGLTGGNIVQGFNNSRDAALLKNAQMREGQGVPGHVLDFVGSVPAVFSVPGSRGATVADAAKAGGILGAVSGFGSGRGMNDRMGGAMRNALVGATIGAGAQGAFNVAGRGIGAVRNRLAARQPGNLIDNADEVNNAYIDEFGTNAPNALLQKGNENRVTGVDASMAGGPRIQGGMRKVEGQVESRVAELGQGGTARGRNTQGQTIQSAGERYIKQSGAKTKALYDTAERMAGNAKVAPSGSLKVVDDAIAKLSETPAINSQEIAFLEKLKGDLSQDLSVGGLRRIRTSLRKKISRGELVFGEDEKTVLGIMDAASDDIYRGLSSQGKQDAADAFISADAAYRDRMAYITETLQKVIGKRGSNFSAERVADNLAGLAKGKDEAGFKKFLGTLTNDEKADMAATFARAIGRNDKGEFSLAYFLKNTEGEKLPDGVARAIFGNEGFQSIQRLRTIVPEVQRITGAMNSRTSKSAIPADWRSWVFNFIGGGGGGAALSGGDWKSAIAGAAVVGGVKAGRDIVTARALLSPEISKWLVNAPRTTNPNAINNHIAQLARIASREGAYRMDAQQILDYLNGVAGKLTTAAAASDGVENTRREPIGR